MYMGLGGFGLVDVPSRMFAAKGSCEGCHLQQTATGINGSTGFASSHESRRQSCVRCHEAGYDAMLALLAGWEGAAPATVIRR